MSSNCCDCSSVPPLSSVAKGPAGPRGAVGQPGATGADGADGVQAWFDSYFSPAKTMPVVGGSFAVDFGSVFDWVVPGIYIYASGLGYMLVTGAVGALELQNTGAVGNVAPGTAWSGGAISPAGPPGEQVSIDPYSVGVVCNIQSNGTNAGTFTSGAWRLRTLNTVVNGGTPSAFIISVGGTNGQVTLASGRYIVEGYIPAYSVNRHRARLRSATGSTVIQGSSAIAGFQTLSYSIIMGELILAAQETFVLEHQCQTTLANFGMGVAASMGVAEQYEQITFKRISDS